MNDIVKTLQQTFHLQDVQDSHPIKRACAEIVRLREESERMRLLAVEAQRRCEEARAALAAEQPAPSERYDLGRALDVLCNFAFYESASDCYSFNGSDIRNALEAALEAAYPRPAPSEPVVTDVMVVAACRAFSEAAFGDAAETCREYMIRSGPMRAALVAALKAQGDGR